MTDPINPPEANAALSNNRNHNDETDTVVAHVLISAARNAVPVADAVGTLGFAELVVAWRPVNTAANAMAETLGVRAIYPFEPADAGVVHLDTAHRQIDARTERGRFHAFR